MTKALSSIGTLCLLAFCSPNKEKTSLDLFNDSYSEAEETYDEEYEDFSLTPKCDDTEVLELAKILATPTKSLVNIHSRYTSTPTVYYYDVINYRTLLKGRETIRQEQYIDNRANRERAIQQVRDLYKRGDTKVIEFFSQLADTNIYGIRPQSINDELQKCECQATASFIYDGTRRETIINYSAQLSIDGLLNVNVQSNFIENPRDFILDKRLETY